MPTDTTPDPRDMERASEAQQIPRGRSEAEGAPDISKRPALPDQPVTMAADVEDEEADPVVDTGPGIAARPGQPDGELNRR